MLVVHGIDSLQVPWEACVVCIGTFDGVHCGHQALIARASAIARERELPCVLVTFDRHPTATLAPDRVPALLCSLRQKIDQIRALGLVDLVVVLPFDRAMAETTATDFLAEVLTGALRAKSIVVGHDFTFGRGREGDGVWLAERIETEVFPAYQIGGIRVSSSLIRQNLLDGDLEAATTLLGRSPRLEGIVVSGQRLGRELGYPTANVAPIERVAIPADGVYAGWVQTHAGRFASAISIGTRPTVGQLDRAVEAFLLDYPGDSLYGQALAIEWVARIRGQEKFDSLEALVVQMEKDVARCREILEAGNPAPGQG